MAPLPLLATRSITTSTPTSSSPMHLHPRSPDVPPSTQPVNPNYTPGAGSFDPHHINNRGIFALFALIGASLVLAAIWFFFWAKNGGFRWRKGDWEDYKSTVLRRKGPNGTTLSGATKTTKLGGGSVIAEDAVDADEKGWKRGIQGGGNKLGRKPRGTKNNEDEDMRAYRHEKPARVGGLNRDSDGVMGRDFAGTNYSDTASVPETGFHVPINTPRTKRNDPFAPQQNQPTTPSPHKNKKSTLYATPASNTSTDSHRPLRPNAAGFGSNGSTPTRSRNSSPRKSAGGAPTASMPGSFHAGSVDAGSRYSFSEAGVSEESQGTKSYYHPSSRPRPNGAGGVGAGAGRGAGGFRRGRGRRDSLSDSEGETVLS